MEHFRCKHVHLSLKLQHPCQKLGVAVCAPNPSIDSGCWWLASQNNSLLVQLKTLSWCNKGKTPNTFLWPPHMYAWVHIPSCSHVCTIRMPHTRTQEGGGNRRHLTLISDLQPIPHTQMKGVCQRFPPVSPQAGLEAVAWTLWASYCAVVVLFAKLSNHT